MCVAGGGGVGQCWLWPGRPARRTANDVYSERPLQLKPLIYTRLALSLALRARVNERAAVDDDALSLAPSGQRGRRLFRLSRLW